MAYQFNFPNVKPGDKVESILDVIEPTHPVNEKEKPRRIHTAGKIYDIDFFYFDEKNNILELFRITNDMGYASEYGKETSSADMVESLFKWKPSDHNIKRMEKLKIKYN